MSVGGKLPYMLPKDVLEGDRLELQHHLLRYALKADHVAPLEGDVRRVLDVGSGTGIWGEEMALDFPRALIVDLDFVPPTGTVRANLPGLPAPNHRFVQANVLQSLPFENGTFDYVHQRLLGSAIPETDWVRVVRDLIRVTRTDGWIELLETGFTLTNAGPATGRLLEWSKEFFHRRGLNVAFLEGLSDIAAQAGLREITSRFLDLPLGGWDPYVGMLLEKELVGVWERMAPMFSAGLGVPEVEMRKTMARALQEWTDNRVTMRFVLVYGRA